MSGTHMHTWNKQRALVALGSGMLLAASAWGQAPTKYTLTNVVGNGVAGYAGDSGAAKDAQIYNPMGLAVDSSGNLYIADQVNHRIRKVSNGTITTVAGTGTPGFSGDDAAATAAQLSAPCGVVVDSSGNLYIADTANHEVRKVVQGGNITRFAGDNVAGFSGDTADAKSAQLNLPTGLALDSSGNLYIADTLNNRIRKVGTDGNINTVAGIGAAGYWGDGGPATSAKLNHPTGVAVDSAGRIYIADQLNHRIRRISSDGTITTIAGKGGHGYSGDGGQATQAQLFYPGWVAVDGSGNVYFSDTSNNRVRYVSESGIINVIAGSGKFGDEGDGDISTNAKMRFPTGLALASGKVYFSDNNNSRIKLLTPVTVPPTSADNPPSISEGGVMTETAFGASNTIAPGSWIEIYGANLGSTTREWNESDFDGPRAPTVLEGTKVTIDGQAAYISYVSPDHLKVQVPSLVGTGDKQITVTTEKGDSKPVTVTVNSTQPGVQAPASFRVGDKQFAAGLLDDGVTYALPEGSVDGTPTRPARPGETVTLFGAGFGPVTPNVDAGETVQQENALTLPVQIMIGDTPASVSYAGLAPGKVGLYQFKIVVPNMSASGVLPLRFSLDGNTGSQTLYIAVQAPEQN